MVMDESRGEFKAACITSIVVLVHGAKLVFARKSQSSRQSYHGLTRNRNSVRA
jgi:hypothetical protein